MNRECMKFNEIWIMAMAAGMLIVGCSNIPAQFNNFSPNVVSYAFPATTLLVKDVEKADDITWKEGLCMAAAFPIYALPFLVAAANDIVFAPYNVPASIFANKCGSLEISRTNDVAIVKWTGKIRAYEKNPMILLCIEVEEGSVSLSAGGAWGGRRVVSGRGRHCVWIRTPTVPCGAIVGNSKRADISVTWEGKRDVDEFLSVPYLEIHEDKGFRGRYYLKQQTRAAHAENRDDD